MLAERQRSMREAEEKGKRQEEERRRAKQDEMYRQIMQVCVRTVETCFHAGVPRLCTERVGLT